MSALTSSGTVLAVLAGVIAALALWLTYLSLLIRRLNRSRRHVAALKSERGVVDLIGASAENIDRLFAEHDKLSAGHRKHRSMLSQVFRHLGVVRYDAFPEAGGQLSFSVAMLNEKGDGLVLTSISGRSDSRVYAKPIFDRRSTYNLSEEEERAIVEAFKDVKS